MTNNPQTTPEEIMNMTPEELTALAVRNTIIKKCPFCWSKATISGIEGQYYAVCTSGNCFCSLGERYDRDGVPDHVFKTIKEAKDTWNTRGNVKKFRWGIPSAKLKAARRKKK